MKKAINVLLVAVVFCSSCHLHHADSPVAYLKYMETPDNQLLKTVTTKSTDYVIQLASPEYMVCKELPGQSAVDSAFGQRMNELKGSIFFLIKMHNKVHNESVLAIQAEKQKATDMVEYYDQVAQSDIKLETGEGTMKPIAYTFENNYGLTPYNTIVVAFKSPVAGFKSVKLVFNDQYHENSFVQSTFFEKDILEIPSLVTR